MIRMMEDLKDYNEEMSVGQVTFVQLTSRCMVQASYLQHSEHRPALLD